MKLQWEPESLDDRRSILEFISADRPLAAIHVDDLVVAAAHSLKQFPNKGRPGRIAGTRELVVPGTRYIAAYRIENDTVVILRILDGARRWPTMADRRRQTES